ncbi:MAG: histidine kinase [Lachnospiraceae bacterium]|nr:histidine kinase [Lachnospiraceae bacterium]
MDASRIIQMTVEGWGVLFCFIAIIVAWQTREIDKKRARYLIRFIFNDAALLVMDILALGFRGDESTLGYYMVRIANFGVFFSGYLFLITGVTYISYVVETRIEVDISAWKRIEYVISCIGIVALVINIFVPYLYAFDVHNRYYRLAWNWILALTQVMVVVLLLAILLNFFKELRKLEKYALLSALTLPFLSLIFQVNHYGISFTNITTTVSIIFIFLAHMLDYSNSMRERDREREQWVMNEKIRLLYNQIKPHFIYNSLTSIYYGLDTDLEASKDILKNLTGYLRGSLDVLDETESIPIKDELKTVKCYLTVERYRFDNRIKFELDVKDKDFLVPAFSIQTLVENAIRHGIRKNDPPEGTVKLSTRLEGNDHIVEITDNGRGFDVEHIYNDDGKHIGMRNTKKRIEIMCNGEMEIESEIGKGTTIRLTIPDAPVE